MNLIGLTEPIKRHVEGQHLFCIIIVMWNLILRLLFLTKNVSVIWFGPQRKLLLHNFLPAAWEVRKSSNNNYNSL